MCAGARAEHIYPHPDLVTWRSDGESTSELEDAIIMNRRALDERCVLLHEVGYCWGQAEFARNPALVGSPHQFRCALR